MIENPMKLTAGFLRLPQVLKIIPVSRSTWYRGVKSGLYLQPVKLGLRASGWKFEAVQRYASALEEASTPPWN
jgi:predicted DNA-binding transcriptional regulator AlpA